MFVKIIKHANDIKKFGFYELLRKGKTLCRKILNILILFFFVPFPLILIFFLRPFVIFRFGIIRSSRVGHFISNTEVYLAEKNFLKKRIKFLIDVVSLDEDNVCNLYLANHYKKKINLYPNFLVKPFIDFFNFFKKNKKFSGFIISALGAHGDRDINDYLYKTDCSIKFNSQDYEIIYNNLNKLGLDKNSKFICLDVRDSAYLEKTYPRGEWNYHNYRDWNINKFLKACESLADRGYKVLRMGKIAKDRLETSNPMIIDYANSHFKSDILDIYLHTRSFFTLTTGTGIDSASYVSKRPMAWLVTPVQYFYSFSPHFFITKHHINKKNGEKMPLSEIFMNGLPVEPNFINNVVLEELTENEIDYFVIEVLNILENKYQFSKEDNYLNLKFWENYKKLVQIHNLKHLHGNYRGIFSPSFLRNNLQLLS